MVAAIRLLVVDDHPVYREGLITMLRAHPSIVEVVGEAENGAAAVKAVAETSPEVVLMDIKMAGMNGIEATQQIKRRFPEVKVVALSAYDGEDYVLEMVKAGASGYMLKDAGHEEIIGAIRLVHGGEAYIHPRLAATVMDAYAQLSANGARRPKAADGLSGRELEVLRLAARGWTNRQVANYLWISERTVDNHVQSIYRKLNLGDRIQLALYALRKGLISADEPASEPQRPAAAARRVAVGASA